MKVNYRQLEIAIGNLEPYVHGSSRGERYTDSSGTLYYDIYSYRTLIFRWNVHTGVLAFFDNGYYSPTTSRLQKIIKRVHPEVEKVVEAYAI